MAYHYKTHQHFSRRDISKKTYSMKVEITSQWRHNERDCVSNHQPRDCLLNFLFKAQIKEKHQSSASLAFVRGIHRWPVNSPHKGPVTRNYFPYDDVIMIPHSAFLHGCQSTLSGNVANVSTPTNSSSIHLNVSRRLCRTITLFPDQEQPIPLVVFRTQ